MTSRKNAEKVMSASAHGGLQFDDEALLYEYVGEERLRIEKCAACSERRARFLHLARLCERHDLDREAVDCYRDALGCVARVKEGTEEYNICRQAYEGLSRMYDSEDDYVWETASQAMDEANDLFQERARP